MNIDVGESLLAIDHVGNFADVKIAPVGCLRLVIRPTAARSSTDI